MRDFIAEYETEEPEYECIDAYEAIPRPVRERLLAAVRELGAECAREAYRQGLRVAYQVIERGDLEALRELLQQYGIDEVPHGYTDPDEQHPIWYAFWAGVADVPEPELEDNEA
jgi:hypothetical protein